MYLLAMSKQWLVNIFSIITSSNNSIPAIPASWTLVRVVSILLLLTSQVSGFVELSSSRIFDITPSSSISHLSYIPVSLCSLSVQSYSSVPLVSLSLSTSDDIISSSRPYNLQRLDHIVLRCQKFQPMFNFYTQILGCTIDEPYEDNVGRFGGVLTHLRAGDTYIDLLSYDVTHLTKDGIDVVKRLHSGGKGIRSSSDDQENIEQDDSSISKFSSSQSTLDHLCLRIDPFDYDKLIDYFQNQKDIPIIAKGERKGAEGIGPSIYIEDPEGNTIELKGPSTISFSSSNHQQRQQITTNIAAKSIDFPSPSSSNDIESPNSHQQQDEIKDTPSSSSTCSNVGSTASTFVSTPCTRICRYNADFYEGQVCIGCFREAYEIGTWEQMTSSQRALALLDAADRCPDDNNKKDMNNEDVSPMRFEGSVTKDELLHQASSWQERSKKES